MGILPFFEELTKLARILDHLDARSKSERMDCDGFRFDPSISPIPSIRAVSSTDVA